MSKSNKHYYYGVKKDVSTWAHVSLKNIITPLFYKENDIIYLIRNESGRIFARNEDMVLNNDVLDEWLKFYTLKEVSESDFIIELL